MPISWEPKRDILLRQLWDVEKDSYDGNAWWQPPRDVGKFAPFDILPPEAQAQQTIPTHAQPQGIPTHTQPRVPRSGPSYGAGFDPNMDWGQTTAQQQALKEGRLVDASSPGQLIVGGIANKFNYVGGPQQWTDWETPGIDLPFPGGSKRLDLKGVADFAASAAVDPATYVGGPAIKAGAKKIAEGVEQAGREIKPVARELATSEAGFAKIPGKEPNLPKLPPNVRNITPEEIKTGDVFAFMGDKSIGSLSGKVIKANRVTLVIETDYMGKPMTLTIKRSDLRGEGRALINPDLPKPISEGATPKIEPSAPKVEQPLNMTTKTPPEPLSEGAGMKPPVTPARPVVGDDDAIRKFWQKASDKKAEGHWEATQTLRTTERAKRTQTFNNRLIGLLKQGMEPEEATNLVKKEALSGKLPTTVTTLGDLISPEVRSSMFARIQSKLSGQAYEIAATSKALQNALSGKPIPRTPGVTGRSAYTRLEKVFGDSPEFMKAIENPDEFMKKTKELVYRDFEPPNYSNLPNVPHGQPMLTGGDIPEGLSSIRETPEQIAQKTLEMKLHLNEQANPRRPAGEWIDFPDDNTVQQLAMIPKPQRAAIAEKLSKIGWGAVNTGGLARAVMSAFDVSAQFRQNLILGTRHPIWWAKSWKPLFQSLKSEKFAMQMDNALRTDPDVMIGVQRYGLELPQLKKGSELYAKAEEFASRYAEKIPGVRASERAFVTPSNFIRANVWKQEYQTMQKLGLDEQAYKEMAKLINLASGRASLTGNMQRYAPALNAFLFSPRLIKARVQLPTTLWSASPYVRKQAWQNMGTFLGFGATVLGLYTAAGGKVEYDPRSSETAKLTIGNTRLDVGGGYIQYLRFLSQIATAERKNKETGGIEELNRLEVLARFGQSKTSPMVGLIVDLLAGETYSGEELKPDITTLREQAISRLAPLVAQDIYDSVRYNEGLGAQATGALSGLGIGTVTYEPKSTTPGSLPPLKGYKSRLPAYP